MPSVVRSRNIPFAFASPRRRQIASGLIAGPPPACRLYSRIVGVKLSVERPEPVQARPQSIEEALERAKKFARVMDRLLGIPGSEIGIGLDAIIGALLPVCRDAASGIAGVSL